MDNNSGGVNNSKESIFANEDKIACEEGQGICAHALVVISVLLIFMTLPFSLCLSVKVVQVKFKFKGSLYFKTCVNRNMNVLSSSAWVAFSPVEPEDLASSSSSPASTFTRRLTCAPRPTMSLRKRLLPSRSPDFLLTMTLFQILTKDSVTVFVNAIMYYKVKDATSAVANVDDYSGSAQLLAATTLRNVLGTRQGGG